MAAEIPKYVTLPSGAKYPVIGLGTFTVFNATVSLFLSSKIKIKNQNL